MDMTQALGAGSPRAQPTPLPTVGEAAVDGFLADTNAAGAASVLLFTGDPVRWPEASDVLVILPELMRALAGRARAAIISRADEAALARRFGVVVYPSLVFWRGGTRLGVIAKVQDWAVYLERSEKILSGEDEDDRPSATGSRNALFTHSPAQPRTVESAS